MPDYLYDVITSPWILAIVLVVAALDAILPMSPSEGTVVAVAVAGAATGAPHPVLLVVTAAAGAYAGDRFAYHLGSRGGSRAVARLRRSARRSDLPHRRSPPPQVLDHLPTPERQHTRNSHPTPNQSMQ